MALQPLYRGDDLKFAGLLRYTWTGWASTGEIPQPAAMIDSLKPLWENDGLRLLEHHWQGRQLQLAFSTRPDVTPVFAAGRAKGRFQDALRKARCAFSGFSRMLAVRSVGDNTRRQVEEYIAGQVAKEGFIDPRFREQMEEFTVCCPEVDLSQPTETARGRYWYNLHVVLVVAQRHRIVDRQRLAAIRDGCFRIAAKKGHRISTLSVMPDHLHVAIRGNIEHSPAQIALALQNNLAYLLGQTPIWQDSSYCATFGEYDMGAIRVRADRMGEG
jgi:REP element-mobilizing transposase RayT